MARPFWILLILLSLALNRTCFPATQVTRYTYDAGRRLISAVYDQSAASYYSYDRAGNRLLELRVAEATGEQDFDRNDLPDLWELVHFGVLGNPPDADPDTDGARNRHESVANTDPHDPTSVFRVLLTGQPGRLSIAFPTATSRFYTVEWTEDPLTATPIRWNLVEDSAFVNLEGDGTVREYVASPPPASPWRFYRVRVSFTPIPVP